VQARACFASSALLIGLSRGLAEKAAARSRGTACVALDEGLRQPGEGVGRFEVQHRLVYFQFHQAPPPFFISDEVYAPEKERSDGE